MNILAFQTSGWQLFRIRFLNALAILFSIGLAYPWAKNRELRYLAACASTPDDSLRFNGSLKTFYSGFLQSWILCFLILAGSVALGILVGKKQQADLLAVYQLFPFILVTGLLYFTSVLLFHALRYRINHLETSSQISFRFTAGQSDFAGLYFSGVLLSQLTLSVYFPWFLTRMLRYMAKNTHWGNVTFEFTGSAKQFFPTYIKGVLLSVLTLGIYSIWLYKDFFNYSINHLQLNQDRQSIPLTSQLNTLDAFQLLVGNAIILTLSLGLGYSWVKARTLNTLSKSIHLSEGFLLKEALTNDSIPKTSWFRPTL